MSLEDDTITSRTTWASSPNREPLGLKIKLRLRFRRVLKRFRVPLKGLMREMGIEVCIQAGSAPGSGFKGSGIGLLTCRGLEVAFVYGPWEVVG